MESVDDLRRALEAARAETATLRAAAEGADRAPRGNDTGDAGEADSAYRETYDDGYARTRTDGHAGANARQCASTANFFWGGKNRPVPKFPKNEDEAAMWHLCFRPHLDGMGLGYTLDHAATPVPVKGDQRDLISRYGEQPVQQAQTAWACLLDATAGAAFEERVLSAVTVRDAWCQILSWTGPSSEAEKLFLERQLETVPNYGDEDPKLFFFESGPVTYPLAIGQCPQNRAADRSYSRPQPLRPLRDREALPARLSFSPAPRRGAYRPRLLGHSQDAPARTTVGIGGDAQPIRACS